MVRNTEDGFDRTPKAQNDCNRERARQKETFSCLNRGALGNPDLVGRIENFLDRQICEAIDENLKDVRFRAHLSHNLTEQVMTQLRLANQSIRLDGADCSYEDIVRFLCSERFHNGIQKDVESALWAATCISINREYGWLLAHSNDTPRKGVDY
jgi:hypothetical protein